RAQYFHPAARGLYYAGSRQETPVYQRSADAPFSFVATGQGVRRPKDPEACWAPICPGMKPHGLRHSLQALIEERGVPKVLVMDRMGHASARDTTSIYSHVTPAMRERLVEILQEAWESALEQRRAMGVKSPVAVVQELLEPSSRLHSRSTPDAKPRLQATGRGRVA
ncbi:tyrosine-type recombinase/integrase, partial [Kitasatospora kifunensis]